VSIFGRIPSSGQCQSKGHLHEFDSEATKLPRSHQVQEANGMLVSKYRFSITFEVNLLLRQTGFLHINITVRSLWC
jgi:hypothetical protein